MIFKEWLHVNGATIGKKNEAEWGSYNVSLQLKDQTHGAIFARRFGWGYTPEDAIEIILKEEVFRDKLDEGFVGWLGISRIEELKSIFTAPQEISNLPAIIEKVPVDVPEHIHHIENRNGSADSLSLG